jgi:5'-3' exonuclease
MGIKYFFSWLKSTFDKNIIPLKIDESIPTNIDTFLVDMNGIFHYCCQKIYKYGNFKQEKSLLNTKKKTNSIKKQQELFEMIGNYVTKLINFVKPRQKVILAIDGPAPLSKQCQQRQRRYRSAKENDDGIFDSNSITPGTKFLDYLSKYMDWYIRKNLGQGNFGNIEIIFSSEKVPGEGEHKLVKFVREHGDEKESFMIHGMDADLIMLSLATHKENFHILRENPYRYEQEYYYINMVEIRKNLVNALLCDQSLLEDKIHINDFITMIFLTGNDFLPNLPTIEILSGGVENLFETYRNVVKSYGTLTNSVGNINIDAFQVFLGTLGNFEQQFLTEKRSKPINFPDTLLEKHTKLAQQGEYKLDWENYRKEYYLTKMDCKTEKDIEKACVKYIEGIQWVLSYYTKGVPNWKWFYPYYYSPFVSDIAKYMNLYQKIEYVKTQSYSPFMQLLCVLPKESSNLLPSPLDTIMNNNKTKQFYPDEIKVDMDGKHNSWEGVVVLPYMDFQTIEKEYEKAIKLVDEKERKRNIIGKSFLYKMSDSPYFFRSFYGDIKDCMTVSIPVDI